MPKELFWLTLTIAMTGLFWIPYVLDRCAVRGLMPTMGNPSPSDAPQSAWAQRMMNAHTNAVENLVLFAPLVLLLQDMKISNDTTVLACAVYFWARLAHYLIYTFGIPVARTLAFTVAWLATAVLVLAAFRLI
jgi:uncharacterized MAPEG superfamily protein